MLGWCPLSRRYRLILLSCAHTRPTTTQLILDPSMQEHRRDPSPSHITFAHNPWGASDRALVHYRQSPAMVSSWVNGAADLSGYRTVHGTPIPYRQYVGAANLWEHGEIAACALW